MSEVETEDSIMDAETVSEWKKAVVRGIPFYLFVPRGFKESAQNMGQGMPLSLSAVCMSTRLRIICAKYSKQLLRLTFALMEMRWVS